VLRLYLVVFMIMLRHMDILFFYIFLMVITVVILKFLIVDFNMVYIRSIQGLDSLGYCLSYLTIIISFVCVLSIFKTEAKKSKFFIFLIYLQLFLLFFTFSSLNIFIFYIFFWVCFDSDCFDGFYMRESARTYPSW